jgi:hypothetical protein
MEYFIRGTANLNSVTNHAISFFFTNGQLYAKIGGTNYCIQTCGAGAGPAATTTTAAPGGGGGGTTTTTTATTTITTTVTAAPNCTSCVQSGSYTSGNGCGGGGCFQTWYTYTCAPAGCVGCNCPDVASGSCGGPACP